MKSGLKTILFVTYGGGHAQMVWPVVNALKQNQRLIDGEHAIRVLALPAAKAILDRNDVPSFSFADYLDDVEDADARAWGEELAKIHHSPASGIDIRESIAYLGLSYKDLVDRLGPDQAQAEMIEKGRHAFFPLTIMQRIFDDIQPDFVVTTNSPRSEAAAIHVANQRGIDNLIMTDLFTGLGDYRLQGRNISFLNRFARDMFVRDGLVDPEQSEIHYTGNPAFDRLLSLPSDPESGWLVKYFPNADFHNLVLHADTPAFWDPVNKCSHFRSNQEILEELEAAYNATVKNQSVYLVRPHPSQDPTLYASWLHGRRNAYLVADFDLHDLLRNISLLLVRTSTVGLEAIYMQKKVLQIDSDFHDDLPLAKMGIAWGVNSYTEMRDEMGKALADTRMYDKMKRQIRKVLPFEPAAEEIAKIVLNKIR
jgi:hypothetical protein